MPNPLVINISSLGLDQRDYKCSGGQPIKLACTADSNWQIQLALTATPNNPYRTFSNAGANTLDVGQLPPGTYIITLKGPPQQPQPNGPQNEPATKAGTIEVSGGE